MNETVDLTKTFERVSREGLFINLSYLGSTINKGLGLSREISNIISRAAATCGKLQKRVLNNRRLCIGKKMAVYNVCILSALWYVISFHACSLRKVPEMKWQERLTNLGFLHSQTRNIEIIIGLKR